MIDITKYNIRLTNFQNELYELINDMKPINEFLSDYGDLIDSEHHIESKLRLNKIENQFEEKRETVGRYKIFIQKLDKINDEEPEEDDGEEDVEEDEQQEVACPVEQRLKKKKEPTTPKGKYIEMKKQVEEYARYNDFDEEEATPPAEPPPKQKQIQSPTGYGTMDELIKNSLKLITRKQLIIWKELNHKTLRTNSTRIVKRNTNS